MRLTGIAWDLGP